MNKKLKVYGLFTGGGGLDIGFKEAGFEITAEDIQSMQSATVELSDDELEGVAGGKELWRVCA